MDVFTAIVYFFILCCLIGLHRAGPFLASIFGHFLQLGFMLEYRNTYGLARVDYVLSDNQSHIRE